MKTQTEAVSWLNSQVGKGLNFDGMYGRQCTDLFNYYYQFLTGRSPYSDGYGVNGAKDLWNVNNSNFVKVPDSSSFVPQPGDILVYGPKWGGGYGHVEMVTSSDSRGSNIVGQNLRGNATDPVARVYRTWAGMNGLIGALRPKFNNVTQGNEDMITQNDRGLIDRLSQRLKLWNPGYSMDKEMNAWVGQDFRKFLDQGMNEADAEFQRRAQAVTKVNELSGQVTGLTQTVNDKQQEINVLIDENTQLKAKLAQAGDDSIQLNALGAALNWFLTRVGIKKG